MAAPSRSPSAMEAELESSHTLVAVAAAAGRETRAPKATGSEDFEFAPFNQIGGLGKAVDLFGGQSRLAGLLDELNEVLAA